MGAFVVDANGIYRRSPQPTGDAGAAIDTSFGAISAFITQLKHIGITSLATGGDGSVGNPYTFPAITWQANTIYKFTSGIGELNGNYNLPRINLRNLAFVSLIGEPGVVIKYTGRTGSDPNAMIDAFNDFNTDGLVLQDLVLDCNFSTDVVGLYANASHRGRWRIEVKNLAGNSNGIYAGGILNQIDSYIQKVNPGGGNGITLNPWTSSTGDPGGSSTTFNIRNPQIEGLAGTGIVFNSVATSIISGSTSEGNGSGIFIDAASNGNIIDGLDCEADSTNKDFVVNGRATILRGCVGGINSPGVTVGATAAGTIFEDCEFANVTVTAGAVNTKFVGCKLPNGITDHGTNTKLDSCFDGSGAPIPDEYGPTNYPKSVSVNFDFDTQTTASGGMSFFSNSAQLGGGAFIQASPANGDTFTIPIFIAAGTYTITLTGSNGANRGIIGLTFDGTSVGSADFYASSPGNNTRLSSSSFTVARSGQHTIVGTITGKNASSSAYYWELTKLQVQ